MMKDNKELNDEELRQINGGGFFKNIFNIFKDNFMEKTGTNKNLDNDIKEKDNFIKAEDHNLML